LHFGGMVFLQCIVQLEEVGVAPFNCFRARVMLAGLVLLDADVVDDILLGRVVLLTLRRQDAGEWDLEA
jgi:hypothetical protein